MIVYTKHAENKLRRKDIKAFKITRRRISQILRNVEGETHTKYGEYAVIRPLNEHHVIRVVYDIIGKDYKVITFHVARKGRY